jgi:hypothetical protein
MGDDGAGLALAAAQWYVALAVVHVAARALVRPLRADRPARLAAAVRAAHALLAWAAPPSEAAPLAAAFLAYCAVARGRGGGPPAAEAARALLPGLLWAAGAPPSAAADAATAALAAVAAALAPGPGGGRGGLAAAAGAAWRLAFTVCALRECVQRGPLAAILAGAAAAGLEAVLAAGLLGLA